MNFKLLIKNSSIYTIGTFFVQGFSFITLPLFSRILSPSDFGFYANYLFWTSVMTILVSFQISSSINNAYIDFGEKNIFKYISGILIVNFFSFILMLLIIFLLKKQFSKLFELPEYVLLLGIIQSFFVCFFNSLLTVYKVLSKPYNFIFLSIMNITGNIILAILFINKLSENKYLGRVYSSVIIIAILGIISLIIIYTKGKTFLKKDYIKYSLKFSLPLIFHSIAAIIFTKCDQLMIMKLLNPSIAGIYSYSNSLGHIMYVLYSAINQAFVPWYYQSLKKGKRSEIKIISKIYIIFLMGIYTSLLMVSPEIIYFISDKKYYFSVYLSPLIIFSFFINFLYTFPVNYEFYHKKTIYIAIGTVICAIFNLITNYFFINIFGVIGAAITTILSYLLLLILHIYVAKYIIKGYELNIKNFIFYLIIGLSILCLYYLTLNKAIIRYFLLLCICVSYGYYILKYTLKNKLNILY